jgi:hypothetical protein
MPGDMASTASVISLALGVIDADPDFHNVIKFGPRPRYSQSAAKGPPDQPKGAPCAINAPWRKLHGAAHCAMVFP